MAHEDLCSQLCEPLGGRGVTKVGAADAVPQGKQHFGNSAHADAANSYKMNALNFCEHDLLNCTAGELYGRRRSYQVRVLFLRGSHDALGQLASVIGGHAVLPLQKVGDPLRLDPHLYPAQTRQQ